MISFECADERKVRCICFKYFFNVLAIKKPLIKAAFKNYVLFTVLSERK